MTKRTLVGRSPVFAVPAITAIASIVLVVAAGTVSSLGLIRQNLLTSSSFLLVLSAAISFVAALSAILWSRASAIKLRNRRIFIVYAHPDLDRAREIASVLKEVGFEAWIDHDEILPGQIWKDSIRDAFEQSAVVVVLMSELARNSTFVQLEVNTALKDKRSGSPTTTPIIPVKLDDSPAVEGLAGIQWVDWRSPDAPERLIRGVELALKVGE